MIVRNEAHVIRRCLASVRPLLDHWIVVDTGSSDGTQTLVREAMAGLPGELVERPWVDFAHNRSEALDLARPHGTYALIIDADDELALAPGFNLPVLEADSYTLDIHYAGATYRRAQVVRNALAWRYRGVLHEFLDCPEARTQAHLPIVMRIHHEGARSTDPTTYARDAAILEGALVAEADPFLTARYTFYLAQSHRDRGEREAALAAYLRRAEMGFWSEEVFVSLYQAGKLMEALGRDPETVLATYARASAAAPSRAEAAHAASRFCRGLERFADGLAVAEPALSLPAPADGLFVEPWIYAYGLADEFAVNAYWCGRHRDCLEASLRALESGAVPEAERPRLLANMRFALDGLAPALAASPPPPVAAPSPPGATSLPASVRPRSPDVPAIETLVALPAGAIVIADVGAAFFGQRQIYDALLERGLARLVAFEPDAREVERLRAVLGPGATIVPRALGDGGRHVLHLGPPGAGMTSLLRPDPDYLGYFNEFPTFGRVVGTREIDTVRLDDCLEVERVDFLRMDVQGSDLSILRHGAAKLRDCAVVQLEVSFVPLYEGQPTFGEIDVHLRRTGFLPHCFAELKRWSIAPTIRGGDFRAPFNQLLEGDVVYVKDGIKHELDDLCLRKIAVIAHHCYASPDLAARCVRALAERGAVAGDALRRYYESLAAGA